MGYIVLFFLYFLVFYQQHCVNSEQVKFLQPVYLFFFFFRKYLLKNPHSVSFMIFVPVLSNFNVFRMIFRIPYF